MNHKLNVLFLGGARSGKSSLALSYAEKIGKKRLFVATAQAFDEETKERILAHRQERGSYWQTLEVPLNLSDIFYQSEEKADVILVDCLTMWLNNMVFAEIKDRVELLEDKVKRKALMVKIIGEFETFCVNMQQFSGSVVLVSNELGLSLVPETLLGRFFRDLSGKINQIAAQHCQKVYFVAAGLSLTLK
ncbi:bifunctional adenosylcobinamide kinase/adenosylcobinamide-phosphate guanylyltransferase [Desulfovibrio litoralis]|uniref:Adenosylcobinamide kinase n=1 Tax=Desulfovibrio litoralis DSM 11393 TaxID=1121455 RepID=A0A1M7SP05_9BACT|nr:bifunctional adenosylcobinamide kinase/adenosylcobinamide-phosphate guanylyltransferase [Desulfovibrio litoralis]SHN60136.1 adenosylcobinamide kinase /adenosylcobinamide-phosphate guanylyltransferase [Desulfovibrio litoralis DSM 11393]